MAMMQAGMFLSQPGMEILALYHCPPMIVSIEGYDPAQSGKKERGDTSGEETVLLLFPNYETSVDLPDEDSTKDFEVPAEAAENIQRGERQPTEVVP